MIFIHSYCCTLCYYIFFWIKAYLFGCCYGSNWW